MDPNSKVSRKAREYQEAIDRELEALQASGLGGREAVVHARHRATLKLEQKKLEERGRMGVLAIACVMLAVVALMVFSS